MQEIVIDADTTKSLSTDCIVVSALHLIISCHKINKERQNENYSDWCRVCVYNEELSV